MKKKIWITLAAVLILAIAAAVLPGLSRQLRQAHTGIGVPHTLCVAVRTEQLNLSFRRAVCLHALERLHGIVQNHGSRIQLNRLIRHNARVMPADALGMVDDKHIVGIVDTEAQMAGIRFLLLFRCT